MVDATGIHAAIQGAKKGKKAQPAKFFCKKNAFISLFCHFEAYFRLVSLPFLLSAVDVLTIYVCYHIRRSRSGHPFSGNQTMKAGGSACHETLPEMKEGALSLKCGRNAPRTRDSSHDAIDLQTMGKTMPGAIAHSTLSHPKTPFLKCKKNTNTLKYFDKDRHPFQNGFRHSNGHFRILSSPSCPRFGT